MRKLYKIVHPITDEVVYIGNTSLDLKTRLNKHLTKARTNRSIAKVHDWMRDLLENNLRPKIVLIMEVNDKDSFKSEQVLIQGFKLVGHPILNQKNA